MANWLGHLKTVHHHRALVRKHCFRVGLYWQGLTHDLSKYAPVEWIPGVKYYQGNRSPNEAERPPKATAAHGCTTKGETGTIWNIGSIILRWVATGLAGMEMPVKYVVEMFCDRMAASKTYRGAAYRDSDPLDYYLHSRDHYLIHPHTKALLEALLARLRDEGEDAVFAYIKKEILKK